MEPIREPWQPVGLPEERDKEQIINTNVELWPARHSECRYCDEQISVYPSPRIESYRLMVCAECAAKAWARR